MQNAPILIIGAGVVGTMTALSFAKRGHKVVIIDSAPEAAACTSYANAGILGICHAMPWAAPSALPLMARALIGRAPGIRLTKLLDPPLWRWGLAFLRNCTPAAHRRNAAELRRLSIASRNLLARTEEDMGFVKETKHDGGLYLFQDSKQFQIFAENFKNDSNFEILTPQEIIARDPALSDIAKPLAGAIFSHLDSVGDCRVFTKRTADYLQNTHGVSFHFGESVKEITHDTGRVRAIVTDKNTYTPHSVILAAGNGTPKLCKPLGFHPLIYPVKGYSGTWTIKNPEHAPKFPFIDETELVAVANYGKTLRVTTLAEFNGLNATIEKSCTDILDRYVNTHFAKAVDDLGTTYWCGHRPATPSGLPYLGRVKKFDNLYINAGHGQLGWTLAQICGENLYETFCDATRGPDRFEQAH